LNIKDRQLKVLRNLRAQIQLLCRLEEDGFRHCAPCYGPAKDLVAKGYAAWQNDEPSTWELKATTAGVLYIRGLLEHQGPPA